jgi:hypothetical protein
MATAHWLKPLAGRAGTSAHVLLWQEEETTEARGPRRTRRLTPGARRVWGFHACGAQIAVTLADPWADADDLSTKLHAMLKQLGALTVWLARGWSDLVLTGLAELIDRGEYQWRYAQLDGARCLFRGELNHRPLTITSLPCWTGGRWDAWPQCLECDPGKEAVASTLAGWPDAETAPQRDELLAVATLTTILSAGIALRAGGPQPTVAAQARRLWRAWLGPRIWRDEIAKPKRGRPKETKKLCYVGPLPTRPDSAAAAERHVCYGLPREQYRQGRIEGPIYVADVASAYLSAYLLTPTPVAYESCLQRPSTERLVAALDGHTGLALVLLDTEGHCYPVRRQRRPGRAVGRYWTWLCGSELASATCQGHVRETHTAWIWCATRRDDMEADAIGAIGETMAADGHDGLRACWRSLYSAAIGGWAGWARTWVDAPMEHGFGRWSVWSGADPETGEEVRYRSIAGKVQRLAGRKDAPDSVPLVFGCVTAALRNMLSFLCGLAGPENVYAVMSDALWLSQDGWQRLQRAASEAGKAPDGLRVKAIYDRAWLTGLGRAVVERDNKVYAILSGVPHDLPANVDGRVVWDSKEEWPSTEGPRAERGVKVQSVVFDTFKVVKEHNYPAVPYMPWLHLQDGMLHEELLVPRRRGQVVDETDD